MTSVSWICVVIPISIFVSLKILISPYFPQPNEEDGYHDKCQSSDSEGARRFSDVKFAFPNCSNTSGSQRACLCDLCVTNRGSGFCGEDLLQIRQEECQAQVCDSDVAMYQGSKCQEQGQVKLRHWFRVRRSTGNKTEKGNSTKNKNRGKAIKNISAIANAPMTSPTAQEKTKDPNEDIHKFFDNFNKPKVKTKKPTPANEKTYDHNDDIHKFFDGFWSEGKTKPDDVDRIASRTKDGSTFFNETRNITDIGERNKTRSSKSSKNSTVKKEKSSLDSTTPLPFPVTEAPPSSTTFLPVTESVTKSSNTTKPKKSKSKKKKSYSTTTVVPIAEAVTKSSVPLSTKTEMSLVSTTPLPTSVTESVTDSPLIDQPSILAHVDQTEQSPLSTTEKAIMNTTETPSQISTTSWISTTTVNEIDTAQAHTTTSTFTTKSNEDTETTEAPTTTTTPGEEDDYSEESTTQLTTSTTTAVLITSTTTRQSVEAIITSTSGPDLTPTPAAVTERAITSLSPIDGRTIVSPVPTLIATPLTTEEVITTLVPTEVAVSPSSGSSTEAGVSAAPSTTAGTVVAPLLPTEDVIVAPSSTSDLVIQTSTSFSTEMVIVTPSPTPTTESSTDEAIVQITPTEVLEIVTPWSTGTVVPTTELTIEETIILTPVPTQLYISTSSPTEPTYDLTTTPTASTTSTFPVFNNVTTKRYRKVKKRRRRKMCNETETAMTNGTTPGDGAPTQKPARGKKRKKCKSGKKGKKSGLKKLKGIKLLN